MCYECERASLCGTSICLAAETSRLLEGGSCERESSVPPKAMLQHHLELCTQTNHPAGKMEGERKDKLVTKHSLDSGLGLVGLRSEFPVDHTCTFSECGGEAGEPIENPC